MAKITFGQITLEDSTKSLQELVQIYRGLFKDEEFALPLISTVADMEELPEEYDETDEDDGEEELVEEQEEVSETPQQTPHVTNQSNFY